MNWKCTSTCIPYSVLCSLGRRAPSGTSLAAVWLPPCSWRCSSHRHSSARAGGGEGGGEKGEGISNTKTKTELLYNSKIGCYGHQ